MMPVFAFPVVVIAGAVIIAVRLKRERTSTATLLMQSRPELAERLLDFSHHIDKDKLINAIGGISGIIGMMQASGAIATLISRHARQNPGGNTDLREEIFLDALCARLLALLAIPDLAVYRMLPSWPLVFTSSLARLFCEMALTLEALEMHP